MTTHFSIKPRTVHLWRIVISDWTEELPALQLLLSPDELERAARLYFAVDRQRFIVARALLRKILHLYTAILPEKIEFTYGKRNKPYLKNSRLNFNVSHSHDMAVFALIPEVEIGVDIEKIEPQFKSDLAERFFSAQEVAALRALPEEKRHIGFYHVWARKEALIKALNTDLYAALNQFSVSPTEKVEIVPVIHEGKPQHFMVESFTASSHYQSAFATSQRIEAIIHWQWLPATEPLLLG